MRYRWHRGWYLQVLLWLTLVCILPQPPPLRKYLYRHRPVFPARVVTGNINAQRLVCRAVYFCPVSAPLISNIVSFICSKGCLGAAADIKNVCWFILALSVLSSINPLQSLSSPSQRSGAPGKRWHCYRHNHCGLLHSLPAHHRPVKNRWNRHSRLRQHPCRRCIAGLHQYCHRNRCQFRQRFLLHQDRQYCFRRRNQCCQQHNPGLTVSTQEIVDIAEAIFIFIPVISGSAALVHQRHNCIPNHRIYCWLFFAAHQFVKKASGIGHETKIIIIACCFAVFMVTTMEDNLLRWAASLYWQTACRYRVNRIMHFGLGTRVSTHIHRYYFICIALEKDGWKCPAFMNKGRSPSLHRLCSRNSFMV